MGPGNLKPRRWASQYFTKRSFAEPVYKVDLGLNGLGRLQVLFILFPQATLPQSTNPTLPAGSDLFGVARFFQTHRFRYLLRPPNRHHLMAPITTCLFVYGTLRQASPHPMAGFLGRNARLISSGRVAGRLYHLGRYPGLKEAVTKEEWVRGDVYELAEPEANLAVLDRYEGCGSEDAPEGLYERRLAEVMLDGGETRTCWVYYYRGPVREEKRIHSGDYKDCSVPRVTPN
jgi:gamma-glutamylcyclotransferase (GGCT)/AIG2-like uncharacterized protein YtfP